MSVAEVEEVEEPTPSTPDQLGRLLASIGLALGALALAEIIGTIIIGFAVKTERLSFISRQGYAFLTQLEKSPIGISLVVASIAAAVAVIRADTHGSDRRLAVYASWLVIAGSASLALGTVLGVLARFRVAELVANQPVDGITRRVLVVFVIRNFGTAVVALLVAVGAAFQRMRAPAGV